MYAIKLIGLYQIDHNAYYRKQGIYCFDFVNSLYFATKFDSEDDETIVSFRRNSDWYLNQYNAKSYEIVNLEG